VQQLFRQKIGQELDQDLMDEVLFPLLFKQKHGPKELLQDIKLAKDTLIITDRSRREERHFRVPTFTPIPDYWTYSSPWYEVDVSDPVSARVYPLDKKLKGNCPFWITVGKRTSKVRRRKIPNDDWGTIDILNELRGLNYPRTGYKPRSYVIDEPVDYEDAYIILAEDNALPAVLRDDHSRENAVLIDSRSQFVNNFLDDVLLTDKRLTWSNELGMGILSVFDFI